MSDSGMYGGGFDRYGYEQQQYIQQLMSRTGGDGDPDEKSNEATAGDPANLSFNFTVSAMFRLAGQGGEAGAEEVE